MRDQARVVVIGGGIVGCSVLYHLAKLGWSDVMLVEKTELTAGSTWHAAGLLPLFNMSYSVGQLHKYSIDLYQQLEAETGQAVSFHRTGNLRLATNQERMDEYRNYCGTANTIGVPFELIGPNEIGDLWPLCNLEGLVGALFHPHDGHVAPVDVTQALAKGARDRGAEINRNTEVTGIERSRAGEWLVKTTRGDITCETVVTATGSWARQVGAMVGLDLPMIPVEHQYIVTDTIPELEERKEAGPARDAGAAGRAMPPTTCARSARASSSGLTRRAHRPGRWMACQRASAKSFCRRISSGWSPISRRRSTGCPCSAAPASRTA